MKKIVALLLAMVITAGLWAGGTAAYASIYTVTTPNIVVNFDGQDVQKELYATGDRWEPGYTSFKNIKIETAPGTVYHWTLSLKQDSTTLEWPNMADVLDVYWVYTEEVQGMTRSAAMSKVKHLGSLSQVLQNGITVSEKHTGSTSVTLVLKMRESAGNEYQRAKEAFDIVVTVSADATGSNP